MKVKVMDMINTIENILPARIMGRKLSCLYDRRWKDTIDILQEEKLVIEEEVKRIDHAIQLLRCLRD